MENFILWDTVLDQVKKELSFFATPVHVQQISKGTEEMMKDFSHDLGIPDASIEGWTVRHFITNYLADDIESDQWDDIWGDTWEIRIRLQSPVDYKIKEDELVRTWAVDDSWKGKVSNFPSECVLVVDFNNKKDVLRAEGILQELSNRISKGVSKDQKSVFSKSIEKTLHNIQKGYPPHSILKVKRRTSQLRQLLVSLGTFSEVFFADGAEIAFMVSSLCRDLGGTTTWQEKTSR